MAGGACACQPPIVVDCRRQPGIAARREENSPPWLRCAVADEPGDLPFGVSRLNELGRAGRSACLDEIFEDVHGTSPHQADPASQSV